MTRPVDPLDPDESGAWAERTAFARCANPRCACQPTNEPIDKADIE